MNNELNSIISIFNENLSRAHFFGKYAEIWKYCRLRIKWFDDSNKRKYDYWRLWKRYLNKTESSCLYWIYHRWLLYKAYFYIKFKIKPL